jgi:hypothetical protein
VERLISIGAPVSFRALVEEPIAAQPVSSYLPGVVGEYEVRDLYAACAPRPVLILNPERFARGLPLEEPRAWEEYDWAAQAYEAVEATRKAPDAQRLGRCRRSASL